MQIGAYSEPPDEPERKVSRYNSAELENRALDALWKQAQNFCSAGLYDKWNISLDLLWGILAGDVSEKDPEQQKYIDFSKEISETGILASPNVTGFSSEKKSVETRAKQYAILLRKHIWLKRLQNSQGKGTAYQDPFEDELE